MNDRVAASPPGPSCSIRDAGAEAFWLRVLERELPLLDLASDRPGRRQVEHDPDRRSREFSPELLVALEARSAERGTTLSATLLAAATALLVRLSGQEEVLLAFVPELEGAAEGGEHPQDREARPFRSYGAMDASFRTLLGEAARAHEAAAEYRDCRFAQLVERMGARSEADREALTGFGLSVRRSDADGGSELDPFDLGMEVVCAEASLRVVLRYDGNHYDRATIDRWLENLENLLHAVVEDDDRSVGALPILTDDEEQQLLIDWNDTHAEVPEGRCLHELFEEAAAAHSDSTAVTLPALADTPELRLSYGELDRRANQLARLLLSRGVGEGSFVAMCVDRGPNVLISMLGVLKTGAAYVPLDPRLPPDRLSYMMEDSGAAALVSQQAIAEKLELEAGVQIFLDRDAEPIAAQPEDSPAIELSSEASAYVIYTSGSTGRPKGIDIRHRSAVNFLAGMFVAPGIEQSARLLTVTTPSFDITVLDFYLPLFAGAEIIVARADESYDGRRLRELIEEYDVTVLQATPATWRLLFDAGWAGSPRLTALCGGEPMTKDLADTLAGSCRGLWNLYGPTETTVWATLERIDPGTERISVGRPIGNVETYILDPERRPVPIGAPGELYIGGAGLARGYLNRPELMADVFVAHPFRGDGSDGDEGSRLYRTGDLARYRADGKIECLGRIDWQIKLRGFRIELGEIESVLADYAAVEQAVVTAIGEDANEKRLVGYVRANREVTPDELRDHLRATLPEYMVPYAYVQLDEFPLTPNKKIDRKALVAPDPRDVAGTGAVRAASTPTEVALAGIWQRVLGLEEISVDRDFFELGGHSLLGFRVIEEIRQSLGVRVPAVDFFENPTISQLANCVDSFGEAGGAVGSRDERTGSRAVAWPNVPTTPADYGRVEQVLETAQASDRAAQPQSDKPFRMRESRIARRLLAPLYGIPRLSLRWLLETLILLLEGGDAYSVTLRKLYAKYHDIEVGDYSTGAFDVGRIKRTTRVGRYTTLTESLRIETANHPSNTISSHGLFYNRGLSFADGNEIPRNQVAIGHDVFIGHNATILFPTQTIGDGAIIAAHAVVSQDVPPYAIVAGYPAEIVRYRFSRETIARLTESRWWEAGLEELEAVKEEFTRPLEGDSVR